MVNTLISINNEMIWEKRKNELLKVGYKSIVMYKIDDDIEKLLVCLRITNKYRIKFIVGRYYLWIHLISISYKTLSHTLIKLSFKLEKFLWTDTHSPYEELNIICTLKFD